MAGPNATDRHKSGRKTGRTVFFALAGGLVIVLLLLALGILQGEPAQPAGEIIDADPPPASADRLSE